MQDKWHFATLQPTFKNVQSSNLSIYKASANLGVSVLVSIPSLVWLLQLGEGPGGLHLRQILCNLHILVGSPYLLNSDQVSLLLATSLKYSCRPTPAQEYFCTTSSSSPSSGAPSWSCTPRAWSRTAGPT